MPVDAKQSTKQEQIAETRELLRNHFKRAKEAQEIANQHDEMVQRLAMELAAMERQSNKLPKEGEVQNTSGMHDTPSTIHRKDLFTYESRDVDLEFQKLSLDLAPTDNTPKKASKNSPNSKYLLTEDGNEGFFSGILSDYPEDTCSETSTVVATSKKQGMFHCATPTTPAPSWPELSGSPEAFLHIYEVAELSGGFHTLLTSFGTGAFHVGVEVYGKEWSYCNDPLPGSGTGLDVLNVPKNHPTHQYQETISLGATSLSPGEVKSLIKELELEWKAVDYNALRRNCVTFAEKFCSRLHVDAPPARVGALTRGLKMFLFA